MELRKGDKVSVTGTVKYDPTGDERIFVRIDGSHEDLWCAQSMVKLVQAKFEIGDHVCWGDTSPFVGEVLAISGEHAWIEYGNGNYCTRTFDSITRMPETEAEPEVATKLCEDENCENYGHPHSCASSD